MAIFTEMYIDLVVALPLLTQVCCNLCLLYFIKDCHLENHLTASSGVQGLNEIFVAIKNDGVAATKEKIHQWFSVFPTLPNHNFFPLNQLLRRLLKLEFYLLNQTINKIATVGNTVGLLPFKFLNVLFNIHAFAKKCTLLQNLMAY